MSAARQVAWSTAVQVFSKLVVLGLSFVVISLSTRYLGQEGYGDLTTILIYISLFAILTDWGLSMWTVREIAQKEKVTEKIVGSVMLLRLLLSLPIALIAITVTFLLPYSEVIRIGIAISTLLLISGSLSSSLSTVLQARLRMEYIALSDIAGKLVSLLLILYVIYYVGGGVISFVWVNVLAGLIALGVVFRGARRLVRLTPSIDISLWRSALRISFPLGAALILHTLYFRVDTLLLSVIKGSSDVGIYGLGYRVYEIVLMFPGLFVMSVFPILSKYYAAGQNGHLRSAIQKSFDVLFIVSFPIAVGGIILAPKVVDVLGGSQFAAATLPMQLLLVGAVFSFLATFVGALLIVANRQVWSLSLGIVVLLLNVLLNIMFIPTYSYIAAAAITTLSELLVAAAGIWMVIRIYRFKPCLVAAFKALISATIMGVVVATLNSYPILVAFTIGGVIYFVTLYLSGGISTDMFRDLKANGSAS